MHSKCILYHLDSINITKKTKKRKITKKKEKIPQLYLCFVCGEECLHTVTKFEENSICCTKCQNWIHFGCANINEESDVPSTNKRWLCSKCVQ